MFAMECEELRPGRLSISAGPTEFERSICNPPYSLCYYFPPLIWQTSSSHSYAPEERIYLLVFLDLLLILAVAASSFISNLGLPGYDTSLSLTAASRIALLHLQTLQDLTPLCTTAMLLWVERTTLVLGVRRLFQASGGYLLKRRAIWKGPLRVKVVALLIGKATEQHFVVWAILRIIHNVVWTRRCVATSGWASITHTKLHWDGAKQ